MSSNSNHINPIITLDNYEEYFILYMDQELDQAQEKMVKDFLHQHPHLQIELDMLMETKLPVEELRFDKSSLLSENMQSHSAGEDLLLFIDDELDGQKKKIIQLELESNKEYHQQYLQIMRAKLDPAEEILHPNKKELYRHERRVIAFSLWMRIAAALILIAAMSVLYMVSKTNDTLPPGSVAVQPGIEQPGKNEKPESVKEPFSPQPEMAVRENDPVPVQEERLNEQPVPAQTYIAKDRIRKNNAEPENQLALSNSMEEEIYTASSPSIARTASIEIPKQSFNNKVVTMDRVEPYHNITASMQSAVYVENAVNSGDKKGSLKTFLRKATRFVEKTTGIDPSNGDDELLIGAVALKL